MSWLFSQALAEEYSAATCSAGEQWSQLNVMPTPHKFWRNDKMIEYSDLSRFGLTLQLLTEDHGEAMLMWYLEVFLARTSVRPAVASVLMASDLDSGVIWQGSFAKLNHDSSLWKTAQCSLLEDSELFSQTWPRWGSMRNGASYLRPIPALPICESASGLWQTPVADDAVERKEGKWNSRGEPKLSAQVKLYPTPTAGSMKSRGSMQEWGGSNARKANRRRFSEEEMCGLLNPEWVEWLMGWPIGWTGLKPLVMDKFREWQRQHGGF